MKQDKQGLVFRSWGLRGNGSRELYKDAWEMWFKEQGRVAELYEAWKNDGFKARLRPVFDHGVWKPLGVLISLAKLSQGLRPRGVWKRGNRWVVQIRLSGRTLYAGSFDSKDLADQASLRAQRNNWPLIFG